MDAVERDAIRRSSLFELASRHQEDGAFEAFVRLLWDSVEPSPLEWAPYMSALCHEIHRQIRGEETHRKLLINIPPGHGKSLLVSVFAPAFEWLFKPSRRKIYFSASGPVARRDSRRTRQAIGAGVYQRLLDTVCKREHRTPWGLAFDQNQKTNFENDDMGFRQCLTLHSGVTGQRADDLVVDDPIDAKEVALGTPEQILKRCSEANTIIESVLTTRVNDYRNRRITMIMQRLHMDDPAGRAIQAGGWRVVCFPLHYDPDHDHVTDCDPRTTPGELLHPIRCPEDEMDALAASMTRAHAEAQLEQRPTRREGDRIKRDWLRQRYGVEPEALAETADEVWVSVDAAKKRKANSDFHAIHVWARKGSKRFMLDRVAGRMGYPDFELALDGVISRWRSWLSAKGGVLVEDTANGTTYLQVRGSIFMGCSLIPFHPSADTPGSDKSKEARATYLERAAEAGAIWLPAPEVATFAVEDVVTWWCAFPRGTHDDDVDAASQLLMRWAVQDRPRGRSTMDFAHALGM